MEKIPTDMSVAAGALRSDKGLWLMHQRPLGKHHAGLWEFPGGKLDPGETFEIALVRELSEELAITIDSDELGYCGSANQPPADGQPGIVIQLYTCSRWQGDPVPQEGGAIDWFGFDEMRALPKPPLDESLLDQLVQKHAR